MSGKMCVTTHILLPFTVSRITLHGVVCRPRVLTSEGRKGREGGM